ncbi:hypothetical protein OC842_007930, partial [Tilletia horrida]
TMGSAAGTFGTSAYSLAHKQRHLSKANPNSEAARRVLERIFTISDLLREIEADVVELLDGSSSRRGRLQRNSAMSSQRITRDGVWVYHFFELERTATLLVHISGPKPEYTLT